VQEIKIHEALFLYYLNLERSSIAQNNLEISLNLNIGIKLANSNVIENGLNYWADI
jgi:hypothetical protein